MRFLITVFLFATTAWSCAQVVGANSATGGESKEATKSTGSVFDELTVPKPPDFPNLSEGEKMEALRKWYLETEGSGVPKTYVRFMARLRREAKEPSKNSKFIGQWGEILESKPQLNLAADGTFTWDYGHSKGVGIWREHSEGIVWIGFPNKEKDSDGKEVTWYAQHFCYLGENGNLIMYDIDYGKSYKRHPPAAPEGATNSEPSGAGQPATRPVEKPEGGDKPQPEAEGRRP
jgi:hypothetical protein